jgi:hypothetical protein
LASQRNVENLPDERRSHLQVLERRSPPPIDRRPFVALDSRTRSTAFGRTPLTRPTLAGVIRRIRIRGTTMKPLFMLGLLIAFAALPASALGAPNSPKLKIDPVKIEKVKKDKSVPEPSTILLVGAAAAGFAGMRKLLRSRHR